MTRLDIAPGPADRPTWHAVSPRVAEVALSTDVECGLTSAVAAARAASARQDVVATSDRGRWWRVPITALTEPLILLLLALAVAYAVFGDTEDAVTIAVVVVAVAALEIGNETRARRAIRSLARLAAPQALVVRDGRRTAVPADQLVPGDVVHLAAGRRVPADVRLVETFALRADEAVLTGEAGPVAKRADAELKVATALADRVTMAHAGTLVVAGRATGIVVATGSQTELGRIATLARAVREPRTPLQLEARRLAGRLLMIALGFSVLIPALGVAVRGQSWRAAVLDGLALAFATIPEELPLLVTLTLAVGAFGLARRQAIVRRLAAAEALGGISVLVSDKTGTLTEPVPAVTDVVTAGVRHTRLGGDADASVRSLLTVGAIVVGSGATGDASDPAHAGTAGLDLLVGNATDAAVLAAAAASMGVSPHEVLARYPFDAERRRASAVYVEEGRVWLGVVGAPETVLALCTRVRVAEGDVALAGRATWRAAAEIDALAALGRRVLAVAVRRLPRAVRLSPADEADLTLVGLIGLAERTRPGAGEAIAELTGAGIRVILCTGDHPHTARAVAEAVGIDARRVALGAELHDASPEALQTLVRSASVVARATPHDKLRLVQALERDGEVVGVLGDGVNDAPALRQATVGIAMGGAGTDVAREAADLVLADDDVRTIPRAVRGGRALYANLRRAIRYYIAAKVALVLASLGAVVLGWPVPFTPIQIIVLEMLLDLGAATAFIGEPPDADLMHRPPRARTASLVDRWLVTGVAGGGLALAAAVLAAYGWGWYRAPNAAAGRTLAFVAWMLGHVVLAMGMRGTGAAGAGAAGRPSRAFGAWMGAAIALLATAASLPWVAARLDVVAVPWRDWAVAAALAVALPSLWSRLGQRWRRDVRADRG